LSGVLNRKITPHALALLLSALAIAVGIALGDDAAERANLVARYTARAAFPLFLLTYAASSLGRLWPGGATRALLRRRRHWGLGFMVAHTIHLAALGINLLVYDVFRPIPVLLGGALSYGLLYLMAFTSTDAAMRAMGRWWKRLHMVGIHYAWVVFFQSYAGSALMHPDWDKRITGAVFALLLLGALVLRLAAWRRTLQKRRVTATG
jgi:DMSO/TMAO reductase YedYZ heme-binding membrane subunit